MIRSSGDIRRFLILVLLPFFFSGCLLPTSWIEGRAGKIKRLNATVEKFHQAVLWMDVRGTAECLSGDSAPDVMDKLTGNGGGNKVVATQVERVELLPKDDEAHVTALISSINNNTRRMETKRAKELWVYNIYIDSWYLKDVPSSESAGDINPLTQAR